MTSGQGYSSYNKRQNKSTTNLDQDHHQQSFRPSGLNTRGGGSSFDVRGAGGTNRSWEMYSSNTNLDNSPQQRKRQPSPLRNPFRRSGKSPSPQRPSAAPQRPSVAPQQQSTIATSAASMARER